MNTQASIPKHQGNPNTEAHRINLLVVMFREMHGWLSGNALRALVAETPVTLERLGWVKRARGPGRFDGEGYAPAGPVAAALERSRRDTIPAEIVPSHHAAACTV